MRRNQRPQNKNAVDSISPKNVSPKTTNVHSQYVPKSSPSIERKHQFSDTTDDENIKIDEELKALDSALLKLELERKKIPKDGACLFRAISEQLFDTQEKHFQVRQECVDFISKRQEEYEPFICVSGMPWDHYLFEMRKEKSWGGQVELHAMSLHYNVNFIIYSPHIAQPTILDNGFNRKILLCYYGNHYDCVYTIKRMKLEKSMQSFVYGMIDKIIGLPVKEEYDYKNIGWSCWVKELVEQQKKDEVIAHQLSDPSNVTDYSKLSGYYNKKEQEESAWKVKINNKNNKKQTPPQNDKNKKSKNRTVNSLPQEDAELQRALQQIRLMERKEREITQNKTSEEYPSLPPVLVKPEYSPLVIPPTPLPTTITTTDSNDSVTSSNNTDAKESNNIATDVNGNPVNEQTTKENVTTEISPKSDDNKSTTNNSTNNSTNSTNNTTNNTTETTTNNENKQEVTKETTQPVKAWGAPKNWKQVLQTPKPINTVPTNNNNNNTTIDTNNDILQSTNSTATTSNTDVALPTTTTTTTKTNGNENKTTVNGISEQTKVNNNVQQSKTIGVEESSIVSNVSNNGITLSGSAVNTLQTSGEFHFGDFPIDRPNNIQQNINQQQQHPQYQQHQQPIYNQPHPNMYNNNYNGNQPQHMNPQMMQQMYQQQYPGNFQNTMPYGYYPPVQPGYGHPQAMYPPVHPHYYHPQFVPSVPHIPSIPQSNHPQKRQ